MKILVLCTGNSARSILLETILRHHGKNRIEAFSAGSNPTGRVNKGAIEFLEFMGYDISHARSKSWDEFSGSEATAMDLVITVCDNAAGETCPLWRNHPEHGAPMRHHFGIADPAHVPDAELIEAFRVAYLLLMEFATKLLAVDFENIERSELQNYIKSITPKY